MDIKPFARSIFNEALKAADPYRGIMNAVSIRDGDIVIAGVQYPADRYTKVVVVGGGKASPRMGEALEKILGNRISGGWINTKDGHALPLKYCTVHECGHPVPDERGIYGTRRIEAILDEADEETLVIGLLSGGGSALMPSPADGISLDEKQQITSKLLKAGASIYELNAVRKHLSGLKGGGMARRAVPAGLHVLILSDVIGDRLDVIASGPAVADSSTYGDCIDICTRYGILDSLPASIQNRFSDGAAGKIPETAKHGDAFLSPVKNTLIGNNRISVEAARQEAKKMGYNTVVLSTMVEGEASEIGTFFAVIASEIVQSGNPVPMPACVISGGETTVTVRGNGMGGRNQEMALAVAQRLSGLEGFAFLSGGTDGTDGPTDAAGGVVDGGTTAKGAVRGLGIAGFLENNDSYHYLKAVDGLVVTGPTGTNVMDVQILLVGEP